MIRLHQNKVLKLIRICCLVETEISFVKHILWVSLNLDGCVFSKNENEKKVNLNFLWEIFLHVQKNLTCGFNLTKIGSKVCWQIVLMMFENHQNKSNYS